MEPIYNRIPYNYYLKNLHVFLWNQQKNTLEITYRRKKNTISLKIKFLLFKLVNRCLLFGVSLHFIKFAFTE